MIKINALVPPTVNQASLCPSQFVKLSTVIADWKLAATRSEAGRKLRQGAVFVELVGDGLGFRRVPREMDQPRLMVGLTYRIRVGKHRWCEVTVGGE